MTSFFDLERWFSAERLKPYHAACDGAAARAADLYGWNAALSAALWRTLGHVEILLRQSMHRELLAWSRKHRGDDRWYLVADAYLTEPYGCRVCAGRFRIYADCASTSSDRLPISIGYGTDWRTMSRFITYRSRTCTGKHCAWPDGSIQWPAIGYMPVTPFTA